ncbi:flavodoxin family protein [candidate division FCPU426 bacterium]|nr:flavodoxin family protein [candidate division FCPU426 bacterium]
MKTLVVYDSIFGNTERIARAIGEALGSPAAAVTKVGEATKEHLAGIQLLIVGSPTRGFRPTPAVKKFIQDLAPNGLKGVKVAAFDTGIALSDIKPRALRFLIKIFGYAAKPIADQLRKKGGEVIMAPEGFLVQGSEGPLKAGEQQRAAAWAKKIVESMQKQP